MGKINNLSLPIAVLIGAIVLGGFYYFSQMNKQESIERQQQVEMMAKKELEDKKYTAEQKTACLGIYEAEHKEWNNVNGWRYDDFSDTCYVQYKTSPKPTKAECDEKYQGTDGKVAPVFLTDYLLCQDGLFTKAF